jgi:hypothetical protein
VAKKLLAWQTANIFLVIILFGTQGMYHYVPPMLPGMRIDPPYFGKLMMIKHFLLWKKTKFWEAGSGF